MANVLHKTADPTDYRLSVNTPNFPSDTWFISPDVSAVAAVEQKYWARPLTDPVTEMDQPAKDAVDAAEVAATVADARDGAKSPIAESNTPEGIELRELIELFNKRDNYLINRLVELQDALDAMKASSGPADNIRSAIPAAWLATATRTRADAVSEYRSDIDSGNVDAGE